MATLHEPTKRALLQVHKMLLAQQDLVEIVPHPGCGAMMNTDVLQKAIENKIPSFERCAVVHGTLV